MLFVKTSETGEVVMSHTNPFDPEHGLGKTEEELMQEGYLFEFLEELPRPKAKEGYRGVTFCDGQRFWFEYREAGAADLQAMALRLENVLRNDMQRKKDVDAVKVVAESIGANQDSIVTRQSVLEEKVEWTEEEVLAAKTASAVAKENAEASLERAATAEGKVAEVEVEGIRRHQVLEESLSEQGTRLEITEMTMSNSLMEIMLQEMNLAQAKRGLQEQGVKLTDQEQALLGAEMVLADSLMQMMMLQKELSKSNQLLKETQTTLEGTRRSIGELTEKVLDSETEMVITKEELSLAQEQLTEMKADIEELRLLIAGGTTE